MKGEQENKKGESEDSEKSRTLRTLLVEVAQAERRELRRKARQDSLRYGHFCVQSDGSGIKEIWIEGEEFEYIVDHLRQLSEAKKAVEDWRKSVRERQSEQLSREDLLFQYAIRMASIKHDEKIVQILQTHYLREKSRLRNELSHIRNEDLSPFNNFPLLKNDRYVLLNLIGKGSFGEVFMAFDLFHDRYVACKLHRVNPHWNEGGKKQYKLNMEREFAVHKSLKHNHIVQHLDSFEIDNDTTCSILEFCSRKDLAAILKSSFALPEDEAKVYIAQILRGLAYLNEQEEKIIHYNLKPANILLDKDGVAKISDFGFCKQMSVGSKSLELASEEARGGTLWYLPPECFEEKKNLAISTKVDVWSAGLIFYQILFGRLPFGHHKTQQELWVEGTILGASEVDFPCSPPVSNEAKDFIRRCLTYNQAERPDALTLTKDPYLGCF